VRSNRAPLGSEYAEFRRGKWATGFSTPARRSRTPPAERRGLGLIDPGPYEETLQVQISTRHCGASLFRCGRSESGRCYLAWYPLFKEYERLASWKSEPACGAG